MDYETKLYLDNLIEAINRPDWWSVILSAISTIAVIVIAVVQIRLQKQQTKAQEYSRYKELYSIIYDIDLLINHFLFSIYAGMSSSRDLDALRCRLTKMFNDAYNAERLLMQKIIDFKLKTNDGESKIREYQYILINMSNIASLIADATLSSDGIRTVPTEEEKKYQPSVIIKDREVQKTLIVSRIINKEAAQLIKSSIENFIKDKKKIDEFNYAAQIAKHC